MVPMHLSQALAEALQNQGVETEFIEVDGEGFENIGDQT